jgi:transcriptional regulator with XRE-family HTH domain
MITEFGKQLRKNRIDKTISLRDMAQGISVSPAYLSAIETGKRNITDSFFNSVVKYFNLVGDEINYLRHLADVSQKEISIKLENSNPNQRDSAAFFARRLNELSDDDLKKINKIMGDF